MKRVYVAGRYSANSVLGVLDNIREGQRWATKVMLAGHAPFAPWADHQIVFQLREGEALSVADYQAASMAWLEAADVVFVTPGWETSTGTKLEIAHAGLMGIRVVYRIEDI